MKEVIFSFFIFSASVKALLERFGLSFSIDITLISGLLIFFIIMYNIIFKTYNKLLLRHGQILLLFYILILLSLLYTPSRLYAFEKVISFATVLIAFFFPVLLGKNFNITNFLNATLTLGTITVFFYYLGPNVLEVELSNYLVLAQLFQICFIIVLYQKKNSIKYFLILIFVLSILFSSARFTMITTFLIFIFSIITYYSLKSKYIFIFSLIAVIILFILPEFDTLFDYSFGRLLVLSENPYSNSVIERINFYLFVINNLDFNNFAILIGHGIGSFGVDYFGIDLRAHPHNIFLEVIYELGLFGFGVIIFFIINTIKNFKKRLWIIDNNYKIVTITLVIIFLGAQKSSSIDGLRDLFAFTSIFLVMGVNYKIQQPQNSSYSND